MAGIEPAITCVGVRSNHPDVPHLALDRILAIQLTEEVDYRENEGLLPDAYIRMSSA